MASRVDIFNKCIKWIYNNTIHENGITVTSKEKEIYPEVTGYYIPSLLQWGERELAMKYARYLCSIQKADGSWYDSKDKAPYVFDSAQILKGLIRIRDIMPEVNDYIMKGCEWILSNMQQNGRLTTPSKDAWGDDEDYCSEIIHIYCLAPIKEAGEIFGKTEYINAANRILSYYIKEKREKIENFSLLSHFYAYVMEGLFDLGEIQLCKEAMERLEKYRNKKGGIPGLKNVPWVCSTGMFQLALVWYKLGELEKGNTLFDYACSLQNKSGGWYGSYPVSFISALFYKRKNKPSYFPNEEISWANKYFLDALAYKEHLEFEKQASVFSSSIDENDGRYVLIRNLIESRAEIVGGAIDIVDIGCGKGRYLKNLMKEFPKHSYYAMDLSEQVMKAISGLSDKRCGSLTCIPYDDNQFDFVYVCEAYEHAINLKGAFNELYRITKFGGVFVIIDKPIERLGCMQIDEWEQWISDSDIEQFVKENGGRLTIKRSVKYEDEKDDGLFRAWIINK